MVVTVSFSLRGGCMSQLTGIPIALPAVCGLQCRGVGPPAAASPGEPRGELAARPLLCLHAGGLSG